MRLTILSMILAAVLLGGCGVKPSRLERPEGSVERYPKTYPNVDTDPK